MTTADIRYGGYLSSFLYSPSADARDSVPHIAFQPEDIARWKTVDLASDFEWQKIPAFVREAGGAVSLSGRFEDESRIDVLSPDDPSFWVPLGDRDGEDERFPISLKKYPVVEITYRCTTDDGHPAFIWTYPGGESLTHLPPSRRWTTMVYNLRHFGFPEQLNGFIFRLYTSARSLQTMEIDSVCFRGHTKGEAESLRKNEVRLSDRYTPPEYPVLDDFIPIGTYMNAETARRMAEQLGISMDEYWNLSLKDLVRTRHNAVILESFSKLTKEEWKGLLACAKHRKIRVLPLQETSPGESLDVATEIIEEWIRPSADDDTILAWSLCTEPEEDEFGPLMEVKQAIESVDPNHPVFCMTRHPSAYPLLARYFAASGINQYSSHFPWEIGDIVRNHVGLGTTQQFWMTGPAFTWATDTPEWSSCPELRIMINSAFANGARGWFSYTYHNDPVWMTGSCTRSLTGPFLAFSDLWQELRQCLGTLQPLLPLFHDTWPWHLPRNWYAWSERSGDHYEFPEGISPTSSYRLRGSDYNLYFIVSNDIRGMTTVTMDIPKEAMKGLEIYDVTDFVVDHRWAPMRLERSLQMVPGQARILMVAEKEVCTRWRRTITARLVDDYRSRAAFDLELSEAYQIDPGPIAEFVEREATGEEVESFLLDTRDAYAALHDRLHGHHALTTVQSHLIETMSVACASDGALCRLVRRGRIDEARTLGESLIPIARELTNLRLELYAGNAGGVMGLANEVRSRALAQLQTIREVVDAK